MESKAYKKVKEQTPLDIQIKVLEDFGVKDRIEIKLLKEQLWLCGVVGSTVIETRTLNDYNFYCDKCNTIHAKTSYAIAQRTMNVDLIFTCKCGNKIGL